MSRMRAIQYSEKYYDDKYEYRHVTLPKEIAKNLDKNKLLSEYEWRQIGIQMSRGWIHYGFHSPEPHILLFRRPYTGENPREKLEKKARLLLQQQQQNKQNSNNTVKQKVAPPKPVF